MVRYPRLCIGRLLASITVAVHRQNITECMEYIQLDTARVEGRRARWKSVELKSKEELDGSQKS